MRRVIGSRAKIEKIEGGKVHYSVPTGVLEHSMPDFEGYVLADPLTLKAEFLDIEKIFYLGSKRRLKDQFAKLVPDDVKTIFDPMCGASLFLAEMAKQGKTIIANDYSTAPFYVSRAIFLKSKPSAEVFKAFLDAVTPSEGYYFQNAKKLFPIIAGRKEIQKFIDGYILRAKDAQLGQYYLGVMAAALLDWFGSFGGPYQKRSLAKVRRKLTVYAKQLSAFEVEGTVTNLDALTMDIPSVDMIYFDPPYSEKLFKYVNKFGKLNSILLQKEWGRKEITQEQVEVLAEKLGRSAKYLFVSTSPACPIKWKKLWEKTSRAGSRKLFSLSGSGAIAASLSSAEANRRQMKEILWVTVKKSDEEQEIEKSLSDPFQVYPDESADYRYVFGTHAMGKSVHGDLRIENLGHKFLIGWTPAILREGTIKEPILTMSDLRKINSDSGRYYKINFQTGEWAAREKKGTKPGTTVRVELVSIRKAPHPKSWLVFEGVVKPGGVGATKNYPGVFVIADRGKAEYGSQKPWFHEYFFDGKILRKGRFFFRQLRSWKKKDEGEGDVEKQIVLGSDDLWSHMKDLNEQAISVLKGNGMTDEDIRDWIAPQLAEVQKEMGLSKEEIMKAFIIPPGKDEGLGPELGWLFINPDDQIPYVLSDRAIKQNFLPPSTVSALPKHWRSHVPKEIQYWTIKDRTKASEMRKELVELWKGDGVLAKAEKGDRYPFGKGVEKARHRHDQCMDCDHKPVLEIIWANGKGHAWFCWPCFVKWLGEETNPWSGKGDDVGSVKIISDGEASKKYADNRNPNVKEQLAEYFASEEIKGATKEFEVFLERLKDAKDSETPSTGVAKAAASEFHLTYQFWKGPKVVREGPSRERYLLWIKIGEKFLIFRLNDNILEANKSGGMFLDDAWGAEEYGKIGYVKPGAVLNPTKDTPSFIRLLDSGRVVVLRDTPELKEMDFEGDELREVVIFRREDDQWYVERASGKG